MHAQQLPVGHPPPLPLGMPHPSLPPGAIPGAAPPHPLAMLGKDLHRPDDAKSTSGMSANEERHRNSISPNDRDKYRPRSPDQIDAKKIKKDLDKDLGHVSFQRPLLTSSSSNVIEKKFCLILYSNRTVRNQIKI